MASKNKESGKDSDLGPPPPKIVATGSSEDEKYFMTVALLFAKKSPDPNTKVGACIVNQEGNIVGVGFNKMPNGCEKKFAWKSGESKGLDTKYPYVCHAELNAIANKTSVDVKGCTIYVTLFPCNECAKILIQSGIIGVCYLSNKYEETNEVKASLRMLKAAAVEERQFTARDDVCALLKSINPNAE